MLVLAALSRLAPPSGLDRAGAASVSSALDRAGASPPVPAARRSATAGFCDEGAPRSAALEGELVALPAPGRAGRPDAGAVKDGAGGTGPALACGRSSLPRGTEGGAGSAGAGGAAAAGATGPGGGSARGELASRLPPRYCSRVSAAVSAPGAGAGGLRGSSRSPGWRPPSRARSRSLGISRLVSATGAAPAPRSFDGEVSRAGGAGTGGAWIATPSLEPPPRSATATPGGIRPPARSEPNAKVTRAAGETILSSGSAPAKRSSRQIGQSRRKANPPPR